MSKDRTPWVVVGEGGSTGKCLRCGEELHINLPRRVEVFAAAVHAFAKLHARCKEPNAEAVEQRET